MDTRIYSLESRDFAEMEHALSAWDHQYRQISPGPFHGSLLHTQTGSTGIFRNRWERAIHYRGVAPKGTIAIAISLAQTGEARWLGQGVAFDEVIIQRCGTEAEYLSAPLWDSVVFAIPEADLAQQITDITHDDPEVILHGLRVARLTPQLAAQIRQASLAYLDAAASSKSTPGIPPPLPEMVHYLVRLLARALVSTRPPRHVETNLNRQRLLIHKAEDYIEHPTGQPLRIGRLCREIGVSERSLRDAFYKVTDTSPLSYLKTHQLNRARRILCDVDADDVLIKQVAFANGFKHLGQFSRDYKQLFGELPSETMRRQYHGEES
jgi:AraC family ethanolamine operon transcriptional activator